MYRNNNKIDHNNNVYSGNNSLATSTTNLTKSKENVYPSDKEIGPFKKNKRRFHDDRKKKQQRILPRLFDDSKISPRDHMHISYAKNRNDIEIFGSEGQATNPEY
jgi:hypothetical protein